jgi:hypothetical protein
MGVTRLGRAHGRILPLLGVLSVLTVLAAGRGIPVERNDSIDAVHAEHIAFGLRLQVSATALEQSLLDLPALGTEGSPSEMTELMTPAHTALGRLNWTWTATVRERQPESVTSGTFAVSATMDGRALGKVTLIQNVSDSAVREGARVTFDLGNGSPADPLFALEITPLVSGYYLQSHLDTDLNYRWQGVGGDVDGQTNPDLSARVGEPLAVRIENGDGTATHNLRVKDGEGHVVAGPTENVEQRGDEADLLWTPAAQGDYRYECAYHANTQHGTIHVAS